MNNNSYGSNVSRSLPLPMGSSSPQAAANSLNANEGTVYRSLSVLSGQTQAQPSVVEKGIIGKEVFLTAANAVGGANQVSATTANSAQSSSAVKPLAHLPVSLACYPVSMWHSWISDPFVNFESLLEHVKMALKSINCECTLVQDEASTRFQCRSYGERCMEICSFDVNVWDTTNEVSAPGRVLIEAERRSGCPYYFKTIISKTIQYSVADGMSSSKKCPKNIQFKAPELPKECGDDSSNANIRSECIERVIEAATSRDYEERIQGCCILADLLKRDQQIVPKFREHNCLERISVALMHDNDPVVKRAVQQIVSALG